METEFNMQTAQNMSSQNTGRAKMIKTETGLNTAQKVLNFSDLAMPSLLSTVNPACVLTYAAFSASLRVIAKHFQESDSETQDAPYQIAA